MMGKSRAKSGKIIMILRVRRSLEKTEKLKAVRIRPIEMPGFSERRNITDMIVMASKKSFDEGMVRLEYILK